MPPPLVWIFIILGSTFASIHNFAVATSLYWYYPWFDIIMHFWGGLLVALGVQALCGFRFIPIRPTFPVTFGVLLLIMILWEVFERSVGLYAPTSYLFDTAKDLIMGSIGGVTGYLLLRRFK